MIEKFKLSSYDSFQLVGDDYENYVLNASRYSVLDENGSLFMESLTPIELKDIFSELSNRGIRQTKDLMTKMVKKWQVTT